MTVLAVALLTIGSVLVSLARRTRDRPPRWRSAAALAGAAVCLICGVWLAALDPDVLLETPLVLAVGFGMIEGVLALMDLLGASGRRQPRWL